MMKKIAFLGSVAAVLLMSACANQAAVPAQTQVNPIPAPNAVSAVSDQVFTCKNGMTATVKYNAGEDKIRLFVNTIESSAILSLAPAASGERYTNANGFYNNATEWHMKNKEAAFRFQDSYGNKVQTVCHSK